MFKANERPLESLFNSDAEVAAQRLEARLISAQPPELCLFPSTTPILTHCALIMTSWEPPSAETASLHNDHASEAAFTAPATTVISGANDDAVSLNVGDGRLEESITTPGGPFSPSQVVLVLCGLIASGKVLI